MKQFNILIFPGGTEIGLEINRALSDSKDITLFAVNSSFSNHAPFVFKNYQTIPSVTTNGWIKKLNHLIRKWDIQYIYPAHDDVIVALKENEAHLLAPVLAPSLATCRITRSKTLTYRHLAQYIPHPRLYERSKHLDTFPIFLKPDKGQGSQRTYSAYSQSEVDIYTTLHPDLVCMEYLSGREFTVDCFTSRTGELLFVGPRERIRTKSGIAMSSKITKNRLFKKYAVIISRELSMRGAWFFQMKENDQGALNLLEVAPRISGTMALNRVRGINFPLLTIYDAAGYDVSLLPNAYEVVIDRALVNRYTTSLTYKRVYVDLDDTIIFKGNVNTRLVALLYQIRNQGKEIILITKHARHVKSTLNRFALSPKLFADIIHIPKDQAKSLRINPREAIFIDDSFSERLAVAQKYNIPTFDGSMIEMLMDERI